eukprot:1159019-Pelagomonas_calceolata.AAC.3
MHVGTPCASDDDSSNENDPSKHSNSIAGIACPVPQAGALKSEKKIAHKQMPRTGSSSIAESQSHKGEATILSPFMDSNAE